MELFPRSCHLLKERRNWVWLQCSDFFVIDSMAFDNIQKQYEAACPDFVEILPGIMPKIIAKVAKMVSAPVIAGG